VKEAFATPYSFSTIGYSPPSGARYLSDEFVGVEAIQYPADFRSHCFAMLIDPEGIQTGN